MAEQSPEKTGLVLWWRREKARDEIGIGPAKFRELCFVASRADLIRKSASARSRSRWAAGLRRSRSVRRVIAYALKYAERQRR
ncbi:hypothetical protein A6A05_19360 [Magnetospirillum moscoviense]|uniref:Uncharacterized protein n=1 Tax=Magnetospirillum moscoviense TaxID=1437059 RepID=A0A178MYG9_9PROT|nr:hypothetical protein A6A05_19360 [Magnetospirillum moscoviense]